MMMVKKLMVWQATGDNGDVAQRDYGEQSNNNGSVNLKYKNQRC